MKSIRLTFPNRQGLELSATLDLPIGEHPQAYAIMAHCFTCGKNLNGKRNMSLALTQHGLGVLRFDFAGIGESEGAFYDSNFSTNVSDILDAAQFLADAYEAPQLLVGHSLGGAAVLMAGSQLPDVKAIATVGAPAEPEHVRHLFKAVEQELRTEGEAEIMIAGRPFVLRKHFLEDIEKTRLRDIIGNLDKALLVMHAPHDQIVGIENARHIYDAAKHPKSFLTLNEADHLLMRKRDSLYAGRMIANWASHYLDLEEKQPLLTDQQAVVRTGEKGFVSEVRMGKHHLLADEPISVGGDDLGPGPYDLLLAALGSCTGMTLRMYADHKKWPLKEVRVHLEHYKDYPSDQAQTEAPKSKMDHIDRIIELEGPLDTTQRARLLEIADRCPVHRTLHSDIKVTTRLAEKAS